MRYFDIIPPKSIHSLTVGELLDHYMYQERKKDKRVYGRKVEVK